MCFERIDNFFQNTATYLDNIDWRDNTVKTCKFITTHGRCLEYILIINLLPAVAHLIAYSLDDSLPEESPGLQGRVKKDAWGHGSRFLGCTLPFGIFFLIAHDIAVRCQKEQSEPKNEETPLLQNPVLGNGTPPQRPQPPIGSTVQEPIPPPQVDPTPIVQPVNNTADIQEVSLSNTSLTSEELSIHEFVSQELSELKKEELPLSSDTPENPENPLNDEVPKNSENEVRNDLAKLDDIPKVPSKPVKASIEVIKPRFNVQDVKKKLKTADLEFLKAVLFTESLPDTLQSIGIYKTDRENLTTSDLSQLIFEIESAVPVNGQSTEVHISDIIKMIIKKFSNFRDTEQETFKKATRVYGCLLRFPLDQLKELQKAAQENLDNSRQLSNDPMSNKYLNARDRLRIEIIALLMQVSPELTQHDCRQFKDSELVWLLDAVVKKAAEAEEHYRNNPQANQSLLDI